MITTATIGSRALGAAPLSGGADVTSSNVASLRDLDAFGVVASFGSSPAASTIETDTPVPVVSAAIGRLVGIEDPSAFGILLTRVTESVSPTAEAGAFGLPGGAVASEVASLGEPDPVGTLAAMANVRAVPLHATATFGVPLSDARVLIPGIHETDAFGTATATSAGAPAPFVSPSSFGTLTQFASAPATGTPLVDQFGPASGAGVLPLSSITFADYFGVAASSAAATATPVLDHDAFGTPTPFIPSPRRPTRLRPFLVDIHHPRTVRNGATVALEYHLVMSNEPADLQSRGASFVADLFGRVTGSQMMAFFDPSAPVSVNYRVVTPNDTFRVVAINPVGDRHTQVDLDRIT